MTIKEIPDFGRPVSPRNPQMEEFIKGVFERHPDAVQKKTELLALLNTDPFDDIKFRDEIHTWEEKTKAEKGYEGQSSQIEKVRGKHGRLKIYHFLGSDSVMFGFDFS